MTNEKIGIIMQKAGKTGDTELITLLGELICELASNKEDFSPVKNKEEVKEKETGKFIICGLVTKNNKTTQNPIVSFKNSIVSGKMIYFDSREEAEAHLKEISVQVKKTVTVVNVPDSEFVSIKEDVKLFLKDFKNSIKDIRISYYDAIKRLGFSINSEELTIANIKNKSFISSVTIK